MMTDSLRIGMDYEKSKSMFDNIMTEHKSGNLCWFTVKGGFFGMHGILQVTGKDGMVMEIFATPDWEAYAADGISHDRASASDIWKKCTGFAEDKFGKPVKEREEKKIWISDEVEIKIKLEKGMPYSVTVLVS